MLLPAPGCPDKKQLIEVQDFFKYTEKAGTILASLVNARSSFARICLERVESEDKQYLTVACKPCELVSLLSMHPWWQINVLVDNLRTSAASFDPISRNALLVDQAAQSLSCLSLSSSYKHLLLC